MSKYHVCVFLTIIGGAVLQITQGLTLIETFAFISTALLTILCIIFISIVRR